MDIGSVTLTKRGGVCEPAAKTQDELPVPFGPKLTSLPLVAHRDACLKNYEAAGHVFEKDVLLVSGLRLRQGNVNKPVSDFMNR